jgi:hypothetical protein
MPAFFAGDLTKNRRKLLGPGNAGQPLVLPDPRALALPWIFGVLLASFSVRASGCTNRLPGEDMAEMREWRIAVESWSATFTEIGAEDCRAPQLEYVPADEFADRCDCEPCSEGRAGHCAHACTLLMQPQALVIADAGRGDGFGRWVLIHESLHVLAQCAGGYADGDAAHRDPRLWGLAMSRAMSLMERESVEQDAHPQRLRSSDERSMASAMAR